MTPPIVGNYSPVNSNLCDQNVTSTLDGISQDLQAAPMSPMPPASQSAAPQPFQNQINDMPSAMVCDDSIGVPIQPNIIDPYRRTGIALFK